MKPRSTLAGVLAAAMLAGTLAAQDKPAWDVTQPTGKTRDIAFTTTEGTWMSIDLSPDSQWLVFDLLGQSYRIPAGGGQAVTLTQVGNPAVTKPAND